MSKTPYRILFYDEENQYEGWDFDEAEFDSAEAAFDAAQERYTYKAFRIVKLCYPQED